MPDYLVKLKYTPKAFEKLIANPQNRKEAIQPTIEKLGGEIKGLWFALGNHDVITILTLPDNVSMRALSMAAMSKGYVGDFDVIPLLSVDESVESMKKASTIEIKGPDQ